MLRSIVAVSVVFVLAGAAGGAYWQFVMLPQAMALQGGGGPPAGFAMPVEAAPVRVDLAQRQIQAIGTLRSNESVIVRPEVAARVVAINFQEGQRVRRGQPLVQLDSSIERAELEQAEAQAQLARANHGRADELQKRGAGTQRALDEAQANIRSASAMVALRRARLEKFTLVAPFDGVVGLRKVSVGDVVAVGAELVNLEQVDPLKVDFRVPELFLPAVRAGQAVAIAVDAYPGRAFAGEVTAIDPALDPQGRSLIVRARVANADDALRPGMFARVTLTLAERPQALFVPEQALVPAGDRHLVFRLVDNGEGKPKTVALVPVRVGERRPGEAEILEGLGRGDSVVTAGLLKIRDGMPVQVLPPGPPPGAGGPPASGAAPPAKPAGG
jgi:membrane fusion protein (multidrug efflux system)